MMRRASHRGCIGASGVLLSVMLASVAVMLVAGPVQAKPAPRFSLSDPAGDDRGAGGLRYPKHADYTAGAFDLIRVEVVPKGRNVQVRLTFASDITDPWLASSWGGPGFSLQLAHVYFDTGRKRGRAAKALAELNADLGGRGWNKVLLISAESTKRVKKRLRKVRRRRHVVLPKSLKVDGATIIATVRRRDLGGKPAASWRVGVAVGSTDPFSPETLFARGIAVTASLTQFGGASGPCAPPIADVLAHDAATQKETLTHACEAPKRRAVIPMVRLDGKPGAR
jgi:carbohydrate-binding DOMON domain-containing protein